MTASSWVQNGGGETLGRDVIGFVHAGQQAKIKVDTFAQTYRPRGMTMDLMP